MIQDTANLLEVQIILTINQFTRTSNITDISSCSGTQTANVVVQEESGPAHILKPHTDWFSGQKTSPINAIAFHPYKVWRSLKNFRVCLS